MKWIRTVVGSCVFAAMACLTASAEVVTIIANRETAIFAENPDYNLGAGNLIAGTNAFGGDNARSLIAFSVASMIPTGSLVNSVTFQVGVIRQSNRPNPSAYELHRLLKDWTEGTGGAGVNTGSPASTGESTWNSQFHGIAPWSVPGGQAGSEYIPTASGSGAVINNANSIYEIVSTTALVADVQGWLNGTLPNNGWIFLGSSEGISGTARRFSSTEVPGDGIASALTPRIIVDYTPSAAGRLNVAAAANGGIASASSFFNAGFAPGGAINGDRKGLSWGSGGGWNDGTGDAFPDVLEISFAGPQAIDEVDIFTVQDTFANPLEPTLSMPFTLYGITDFQVQYWDGLSWATIPGGNISGNNRVWSQLAFGAITTTKIRIQVTGALNAYSRITEVEAYTAGSVPPGVFSKSSPANGAIGQSLSPTLNWIASNFATSYEYCVDTINNNSCDTAWTGTANTNAVQGGLTAGIPYYWQVRARNGSGTVDADSGVWWSLTTSSANRVNVAAAANGGTAIASSIFNSGYAPGGAIDGDRKGLAWGSGGGWNDGTGDAFPDVLEIDFAGPQTIDEVDIITIQDAFSNPIEPTLNTPFTLYGISDFQVQYWDGLSWAIIPGGNITGNDRVWRQLTFGAITTTKIRVYVTAALNSYSRITEVEAYSAASVLPTNFAASTNGGIVLASSIYSAAFDPAGAINGDRNGIAWGNGGGWNDATPGQFPDSIQINFAGAQSITEIDIFTLQDNYEAPLNATPAMTFSLYGITDFQVQYLDGSNNWVNVPNGAISNNRLVWQKITFPALTTNSIRIHVTGAVDAYSRITEVEAY